MELLSFAFDSRCKFRFSKCRFEFEETEFVLYAGDADNCEVIQVIINDESERERIYQVINKFLNDYGWANYCSFDYRGFCGFGLKGRIDLMKIEPRFIVPRNDRNLIVNFDTFIYTPTNELDVALSLYNEAKFTQNIFYRFLCFWKILSIQNPNRPKENASDFINKVIEEKKIYLDKFIEDLLKKRVNIGKHLYENFRCAIVHITRSPIKLSNNSDDYREVSGACNLIEHFVRYFIKEELGLPRHHTKINVLEKD
jgi:hypothetical protein